MRAARATLLACLAVAPGGCWEGNYLAQQGVGQLRLLRARRRVSDVLADPMVAPRIKERLALAMQARRFGIEVLGLRGGDAYTRYVEMGGAPVAWNVTAAEKDRLAPHVHTFPLVGKVPYLGFFRETDARREVAQLERRGLDTFLRPVAGYSTLGLTADPIYSSMLEDPPARVVEVMLHEMLHGTVYLAGHTEWNESLATFVGLRGAAAFFAREGNAADAAALIAEADSRQRDQEAFADYLQPVIARLNALYAEPLERAEKLARRELVFAQARADYLARFPPKPGKKPGSFIRQPLNNAVVLSYAAYHQSTPEHQAVYAAVGEDLGKMVKLYVRAVENQADPIGWLADYVARARTK